MILNFKIKEKKIFKLQDKKIDNLSYYKCKFYFDYPTWNNKEIFVNFINDSGYSKSVFLGKYESVLSCTIPKRIITDNQTFQIFLYANNIKTNKISVHLFGQTEQYVERDQVIENVLQQIDKKIDNVVFNNNRIEFYSNNNLINTIYIDNIDVNIIKSEMQSYFAQMNPKIDNIVLNDNVIICYADSEIICEIPLMLSDVAWTGSYNDLKNIPNEFNPSQHTHEMIDVIDYEDNVSMDLNVLLDNLSDEINKE